ncbi:MAG: enoyl-CoA hydratase-related protein [Bacteroidota bacterium]
MPYQTLLYEKRDGILIITMNRPEVYNAFNEQMKKEMNEALKKAEKDTEVRCVVIRGAGEKAFCSGQDMKEHTTQKRSLKDSLEESYNPMIRRIRTMEKPVVAMLQGVAAGAGCSLALACDMRIASDKARLIEVFIRIGLVPDSGSHWFLTRLVGLGKAFELASLGDEIPADEALRLGLVNKVVPTQQLEEETMKIAERLAQGPTKAFGLIKRALNKAVFSDLDTILQYEAFIQEIASRTEDHREGVQAFLEKRPARFKGR